MRYLRLLSFVAGGVWAVEPAKAQAVIAFLARKAAAGDELAEAPAPSASASASVQAAAPSGPDQDKPAVAVLPLHGLITPHGYMVDTICGPAPGAGTSLDRWTARLAQLAADPKVSAIVLDVDSPGGSVAGVTEAWTAVRNAAAEKPVIAAANSYAASAAYWIASAAMEIYVTPSGEAGSIGVYSYHEDLSKALADAGVTPTLIKAGENKAEGHPAFPLAAEAAAYMQGRVNDYYGMFVRDVAKGRSVGVDVVKSSFGGGRMLGARDAVSAGMADRVGTLADAIKRANGLAKSSAAGQRTARGLDARARAIALS